ncbi:MAG: AAA family ATPase [Candidatus Aminicenantes bacterium]|nr:AAA family ATPase [Candidatus Aminicenantes bacterium]
MKISVPREEIERIMKQYECSEARAIKSYLDAQELSKTVMEEELSRQLGARKDQKERTITVYTPQQIKEHLDRYVISQEEYKKRLSIAASFHFAIIKHLEEEIEDTGVKRFRKKNTLISGPSGSGKTYCAEVLGDLLEIPTLIIDATDYTEAGYVGKSADDMIRELIDVAPGADRQEQADFISRYGGIIFVDEIDKKAKDRQLIGHDISREGFQRAVLKLVERKYVSIDNPMSPASQFREAMDQKRGSAQRKRENMISTENILFIVGGSFQRPHNDLESIVNKRLKHAGGRIREDGSFMVMGFGAGKPKNKISAIRNRYKEANADDYIRFGLIPELVGRIPIRSYVNLLSKNDLIRIMRDTEDSIIHQYTMEFKAFGIDLLIEDEAIEYIAELAENKKTGARALVSVWENILTDFQYELPGSNFKDLAVTKELCRAPKDALLKMLKRSPFADYAANFKQEYGIRLVLDTDVQDYIERYAAKHELQVSEALKRLLQGASALNYMNITDKFKITLEMLENEKYFDNIFAKWHRERSKELGQENREQEQAEQGGKGNQEDKDKDKAQGKKG